MSSPTGAKTAGAALATIVAITGGWWALALWPVPPTSPDWFLRTRAVCFGATADTLPSAVGWALLVGQPIGMIALLVSVWGADLRAGVALVTARATGQLAVGIVSALLVAGAAGVVIRVRTVGQEPFSAGAAEVVATLTRVSDAAPSLALIDQAGRNVTLESFRGRPVVVTFAFAHCRTVCPLVVSDVLSARGRGHGEPPAVLIVTLDPWRDTPGRLASIAKLWGLSGDAYVLSGPPAVVERTLNAWRVPRARNEKTGDISHPPVVYVVGADGRITYVVSGDADAIAAAVRAL